MLIGRRNSLGAALARAFPERRLFLRSDTETRFVRLSPATQAIAVSGSALLVGWTILASAVVLMDSIGADDLRDNAAREQSVYENRLNALSTERDTALTEARAAQDRFQAALQQVSDMQSELLESETRREELERGMGVAHANLRKAILERESARAAREQLAAQIGGDAEALGDVARLAEFESTIGVLARALDDTADHRDTVLAEAAETQAFAEEVLLEAQLRDDRNERSSASLKTP